MQNKEFGGTSVEGGIRYGTARKEKLGESEVETSKAKEKEQLWG